MRTVSEAAECSMCCLPGGCSTSMEHSFPCGVHPLNDKVVQHHFFLRPLDDVLFNWALRHQTIDIHLQTTSKDLQYTVYINGTAIKHFLAVHLVDNLCLLGIIQVEKLYFSNVMTTVVECNQVHLLNYCTLVQSWDTWVIVLYATLYFYSTTFWRAIPYIHYIWQLTRIHLQLFFHIEHIMIS